MVAVVKRWAQRYFDANRKLYSKHQEEIHRKWMAVSQQTNPELLSISLMLRDKLQYETIKGTEDRSLAFALVSEAVHRTLGIRVHDTQLTAGWLMSEGKAVEMATGEGKTIASLLPLYWYALHGKGVHMITVNPYLAHRDYLQAKQVLGLLGVSVGLNEAALSLSDKQEVYKTDITFGTWSEFGFDYLRNHMVADLSHQVGRGLAVAIIDEMDSVLIDEARTPMVIAGAIRTAPDLYRLCSSFTKGLQAGRDYELEPETRQVMFTDCGIHKVEAMFHIDNLYNPEYNDLYHHLLLSLQAAVLMEKDRDYVIRQGKVQILDTFTGRILEGRQFNDGLHQAIEAKEGLQLTEQTSNQASITVQKFFQLYRTLIGLSGTLCQEEEELHYRYGLDVVRIPTHKPVIRKDLPDLIFSSKETKLFRLTADVMERYSKGQPVLIGTTSIPHSLEIAEHMEQAGVPYQLLNALTESEEAEIIARAGSAGAVTIATNMAGRGTDIRLDHEAQLQGGLHVIGTERNESRRIDLQLRGRAGRQGDAGSSQFYLSLEDDIVLRYGLDGKEEWLGRWTWGHEGASNLKLISYMDQVQKQAERLSYDLRAYVYELDSVIHEQREWFYEHRKTVISPVPGIDLLLPVIRGYIDKRVKRRLNRVEVDYKSLCLPKLVDEFKISNPMKMTETEAMKPEQYSALIQSAWLAGFYKCWEALSIEEQAARSKAWKVFYLQLLDEGWSGHLRQLEQLKQGLQLQAYAHIKPKEAYERESIKLFQAMIARTEKRLACCLIDWTGRRG